jgi:hypothetical protein
MIEEYTIKIQPDGERFKATVEDTSIVAYGKTRLEAAENADIAIDKARAQALEAAKNARAKRHQVA